MSDVNLFFCNAANGQKTKELVTFSMDVHGIIREDYELGGRRYVCAEGAEDARKSKNRVSFSSSRI